MADKVSILDSKYRSFYDGAGRFSGSGENVEARSCCTSSLNTWPPIEQDANACRARLGSYKCSPRDIGSQRRNRIVMKRVIPTRLWCLIIALILFGIVG